MMKKGVIFFLFFLFIFASPATALKEFSSSYRVVYQVESRGAAKVRQQISLTNNFSHIYPKEYHLEIGRLAQSITAWDEEGSILKEIKQEKEKTQIKLRFNQQVVGKGKTLSFTLEYFLPNFAVKKGRIWEIILPQINNLDEIEEYQTEIIVPSSFGHLSYASIKPEVSFEGGKTKITFFKNQLRQGAVMIAFGDFQAFDFSLSYYLTNPTNQEGLIKIALPPETNYQEVFYLQISPQPEDVDVDENGNWLALYRLKEKEKIKVQVKGQAKILAEPKPAPFYNQEKNLPLFLRPDKYWETTNPSLVSLAQQLKTPARIYQWVVENLNYDYSFLTEGERKGAWAAFTQKEKNLCTGFTDLFVTLCRAAGIPAREIQGFAYTNNPQIKPLSLKRDVLHAWPEYWDSHNKRWVQVDPTWEKTTGGIDYFHQFDLNHFAFVIHGSESDQPLPPGSYSPQEQEKTVFVDFSSQPILFHDKLSFPQPIKLFIDEEGKLNFSNQALFPLKEVKLTFLGYSFSFLGRPLNLSLFSSSEKEIKKWPLIPPLGKEKASLPSPPLLLNFLLTPHYQLRIEEKDLPPQTVKIKAPSLRKKLQAYFNFGNLSLRKK